MATGTLQITGDTTADGLLNHDSLALVLGMLLDQQVPMEWAFMGPATLKQRLGHLDAARIAAMDPEELVAVFCEKPALHRYPAAMARRAHELCVFVTEEYGGDASRHLDGRPVRHGARASGCGRCRGTARRSRRSSSPSSPSASACGRRVGRPRPGRSPIRRPARWPTSTHRSRWPRCGSGRRHRRRPRRTSRTARSRPDPAASPPPGARPARPPHRPAAPTPDRLGQRIRGSSSKSLTKPVRGQVSDFDPLAHTLFEV